MSFSIPNQIPFVLSFKEFDAAGENKVPLIWKHQLMQFNNLSVNMAAAIVAIYPSPAHLLQVISSLRLSL